MKNQSDILQTEIRSNNQIHNEKQKPGITNQKSKRNYICHEKPVSTTTYQDEEK